MRTHHLTKIFNSILILFALVLFAVCYQKLNTDQNSRIQLENIIGSVLERKNIVQLKHPNEIAWKFISSEEKNPLINNDAIFTHLNSEANISLDQGQEITIQSQSLVRVKTAQEIDLKEGKVAIKVNEGQKPLKLIIDNTTYELSAKKNSTVQIEKKFKRSFFKVERGQVELKTPQEKINLTKGMSTFITPQNTTVESSQFTLLAPQGVVVLEQGESLTFSYDSDQTVEAIHIKRRDSLFKISPDESINLKPEEYKWGITTPSNATPLIWQEFTLIKNIQAPTALSPKANTILDANELNSLKAVQWNSPAQTQLEVLDHSKNLIHSFLIKNNYSSLPKLVPGKYYYQLRVNENFYRSPHSKAVPFYVHNLNDQNQIQKIEISKPDQLIEFQLNTPPASEATLVLSQKSDLSSPLFSKRITGTKAQFRVKETGMYYWKWEGQEREVQFKKILIIPTPPPVKAPEVKDIIKKIPQSSWWQRFINFFISNAYAQDDTQVLIQWQKIKDAKSYEIEIFAQKADSKPLFKQRTQSPQLIWKAPLSKTYYYRVRYQDHWDRYSPYSPLALISFETNQKKIISQSKSESKSQKRDAHHFSFYYALSQITQTQKLTNSSEAKIEGVNTTGHAFAFKKKASLFFQDDSLNLFYQSRYGEVFDGENFSQRYLDLAWENEGSRLNYSFGVSAYQFSQYELNDNQVTQSSDFPGLNLLLKIAKPINWGKNQVIKPFMTIKAFNGYQFLSGLSYENHLFSKSFLSLKLSYEINRFNNEDLEHDSSLIQVLTGITQKY